MSPLLFKQMQQLYLAGLLDLNFKPVKSIKILFRDQTIKLLLLQPTLSASRRLGLEVLCKKPIELSRDRVDYIASVPSNLRQTLVSVQNT